MHLKHSSKFTLSFKYIATESASSGPLVHSRIFLAQYILQKTTVSTQSNLLKEDRNAETKIRIQCFLGVKGGKKQFGLVSIIKNIQKVSTP
jgi:hypothetical protein